MLGNKGSILLRNCLLKFIFFFCRGFAFMSNTNLMVLSSKNVFVQKGFINGFCEKLVYKKKLD